VRATTVRYSLSEVGEDVVLGPPVAIGEIVAGKYRVERLLGVGAMGIVVSARHTTLDQAVAIKFLVDHRLGSREQSIARFLAEARAAARIVSDHVCRVFDVGTLPNGTPFMVMEHLEGNDLEEELHVRGQLGIGEAVDYVLQAADAIAAAHQLGVVHRDLKPANLFLALRPDGSRRVKVLDFGVSQASSGGASSTSGGPSNLRLATAGFAGPSPDDATETLGTPAYMSPEQIRDPLNVDARADVWALGTILYEMLTSQTPFVGRTIDAVLDRVLDSEPCPIRVLRREVPAELEGIVLRCLERDRDCRWASAAHFAVAVAPFGSVGVMSQLACVQRDLGSIGSIRPSPVPSLGPMVASVGRRDMVPIVDAEVLRARGEIVHDWSNLQARRRMARAALLGVGSAALVAASIAVVLHTRRAALPDVAPAAPAMAISPPYLASPLPTFDYDEAGAVMPPAVDDPPKAGVAKVVDENMHPAISEMRPPGSAAPQVQPSRPDAGTQTTPRERREPRE
jgi:eukaryotic-like serine/threonine-protein kinase